MTCYLFILFILILKMFEVFSRIIEKENICYYQSQDFRKTIHNKIPPVINDRILYLLCCYKWHSINTEPIKKISKHPKILNLERKGLINFQLFLFSMSFFVSIPCLLDLSYKLRMIGMSLFSISCVLAYNNDYFNKILLYKFSDYQKYLVVDIDKKEIKKELLKYNIRV